MKELTQIDRGEGQYQIRHNQRPRETVTVWGGGWGERKEEYIYMIYKMMREGSCAGAVMLCPSSDRDLHYLKPCRLLCPVHCEPQMNTQMGQRARQRGGGHCIAFHLLIHFFRNIWTTLHCMCSENGRMWPHAHVKDPGSCCSLLERECVLLPATLTHETRQNTRWTDSCLNQCIDHTVFGYHRQKVVHIHNLTSFSSQ